MSARTESYYDIYLFAPNKRLAVTKILENILVEIKQTLVTQNVTSFEAHGNVLLLFHREWVTFTSILNTRERRVILRPDGLFRALVQMFPAEMPSIYAANANVATVLDALHINVNGISK